MEIFLSFLIYLGKEILNHSALIISIIALILSIMNYRRISFINKPKVSNAYFMYNYYKIEIEDYSGGKNLRIDKVYILTKKKFFHKKYKIDFDLEKNNDRTIVSLSISQRLEYFNTIIKTNYGRLKISHKGIF